MKKNVIYFIIKAIIVMTITFLFGFAILLHDIIVERNEYKERTLGQIVKVITVLTMLLFTNVCFWVIILYVTGIF